MTSEELEQRLIDRENETDELIKAEERKREAAEARLREVEAERVRAREEWTAALLKSEAEVRALRDGAADLLEATKNWSDIRIHDARNKLRAALASAPEPAEGRPTVKRIVTPDGGEVFETLPAEGGGK